MSVVLPLSSRRRLTRVIVVPRVVLYIQNAVCHPLELAVRARRVRRALLAGGEGGAREIGLAAVRSDSKVKRAAKHFHFPVGYRRDNASGHRAFLLVQLNPRWS